METKGWPLKTIFRIIVLPLALSTASQFEVMRHSRLRRTIGLPRRAGAATCLPTLSRLPSLLVILSIHYPSTLTCPPPVLPTARAMSSFTFASGSSVTIFASPFWFIRNTSILRPVVHVKSHPIPFSFPANNRASGRPRA